MRYNSHGQEKPPFLETFLLNLRIKQIKKHLTALKNPEFLVDLGCGYNAVFLRQIQKQENFKILAGLDLRVNFSLNRENLQLQEADLNKPLCFKDSIADIIVFLAVLEHLSEPLLCLKECHRVLKPGGFLFLTTPSPQARHILEFLAFLRILSPQEVADHKHYFSKKEIREILGTAGFQNNNIKIKPFQFGFNNLVIAQK